MSLIPEISVFIAAAQKLYEDTRDLSKHEATHAMALALLRAHGDGGASALKGLIDNPIILAATPKEARS